MTGLRSSLRSKRGLLFSSNLVTLVPTVPSSMATVSMLSIAGWLSTLAASDHPGGGGSGASSGGRGGASDPW